VKVESELGLEDSYNILPGAGVGAGLATHGPLTALPRGPGSRMEPKGDPPGRVEGAWLLGRATACHYRVTPKRAIVPSPEFHRLVEHQPLLKR
jgi:hypothetical protein